jgi:hypothetical protein
MTDRDGRLMVGQVRLAWRVCRRCGILFRGRLSTEYWRACGKHPHRKLRRA